MNTVILVLSDRESKIKVEGGGVSSSRWQSSTTHHALRTTYLTPHPTHPTPHTTQHAPHTTHHTHHPQSPTPTHPTHTHTPTHIHTHTHTHYTPHTTRHAPHNTQHATHGKSCRRCEGLGALGQCSVHITGSTDSEHESSQIWHLLVWLSSLPSLIAFQWPSRLLLHDRGQCDGRNFWARHTPPSARSR